MPIIIDLLADGRDEEEARQRSPVRLGLRIAGVLILFVLIWMAKIGLDIYFAQSAYNDIKGRVDSGYVPYAATTNNIIRIAQIDQKMGALERLATNRFLWAPLLSTLQKTTVKDVQVTRLAGTQRYDVERPRSIGSGASKKVIPGSVTESVSLLIQGNDNSTNEQGYVRYKERLDGCDYFVKGVQRRSGFALEGVQHLQSTNALGVTRRFTPFVLSFDFPATRRSE